MDDPEVGPLADGADPAVCGTPVESLAVMAVQDRSLASLAEGEVDGPGHPGNQGDDGRLVALPNDAQGAVAPVEAEVLGIGGTGLAHPQTIQAQQSGQSSVVGVVALCREEEPTELASIKAAALRSGRPWAGGHIALGSRRSGRRCGRSDRTRRWWTAAGRSLRQPSPAPP
jgi:hypothetical protein